MVLTVAVRLTQEAHLDRALGVVVLPLEHVP
jgi:hypothetical protein